MRGAWPVRRDGGWGAGPRAVAQSGRLGWDPCLSLGGSPLRSLSLGLRPAVSLRQAAAGAGLGVGPGPGPSCRGPERAPASRGWKEGPRGDTPSSVAWPAQGGLGYGGGRHRPPAPSQMPGLPGLASEPCCPLVAAQALRFALRTLISSGRLRKRNRGGTCLPPRFFLRDSRGRGRSTTALAFHTGPKPGSVAVGLPFGKSPAHGTCPMRPPFSQLAPSRAPLSWGQRAGSTGPFSPPWCVFEIVQNELFPEALPPALAAPLGEGVDLPASLSTEPVHASRASVPASSLHAQRRSAGMSTRLGWGDRNAGVRQQERPEGKSQSLRL